jgi:hypothetical protein
MQVQVIENRYKNLFKTELNEMTCCNVTKHSIMIKDNLKLIIQGNCQVPKPLEKELIMSWIEENIIKNLVPQSKYIRITGLSLQTQMQNNLH